MSNTAPRPPRTSWGRAILTAVGGAVVVGLVLLAFIWPTLTSSVHNLPVAIGGNSQQVSALKSAIRAKSPGTFDFVAVSGKTDAEKLIRTRAVYGAILLESKPQVLTASANGVAVVQILDGVATEIQSNANAAAKAAVASAIAAHQAPAGTVAPTITVTVTDVVPLVSKDSRGLGLSAAAFPLALGGMLGGILIALLVTGSWRRLLAVAVYSILGGVVVTVVMQNVFGVLDGNYLLTIAALTLAMAGTASFVVGMNALIGTPGVAVGSVVTTLIGNPLSAATQPLQFLVGPWGAVGQWFVPGASTTLIRDIAYFPDSNPKFAWLVLGGWAVLGIIATVAGHFRNQRDITPAPAEEGITDVVPTQAPKHAAMV